MSRSETGLRMAGSDLYSALLLREIPASADPGDNVQARARLYPPIGTDQAANADWSEYVQPELEHLFKSAVDTVKEDLAKMERSGDLNENWELEIPAAHFDAWLNVLNQARLALAARYEYTEREMDQRAPWNPGSPRDARLVQVHFYGFLQECLLQEM